MGQCSQRLLDLSETWLLGGKTRKPWALLDALGALVVEEGFLRWSRSQVLRISSALYRRFEGRLAAWPYRLYALANEFFTEEEKLATATALLQADVGVLDVYSRGIKAMFPTMQRLLSHRCATILAADFKVHPFGTDSVERLNAELARGHPSRAPARTFSHMARESVLRQTLVERRAHNGIAPVGHGAMGKQEAREAVMCHPFLRLDDGSNVGNVVRVAGAEGFQAFKDRRRLAESRMSKLRRVR